MPSIPALTRKTRRTSSSAITKDTGRPGTASPASSTPSSSTTTPRPGAGTIASTRPSSRGSSSRTSGSRRPARGSWTSPRPFWSFSGSPRRPTWTAAASLTSPVSPARNRERYHEREKTGRHQPQGIHESRYHRLRRSRPGRRRAVHAQGLRPGAVHEKNDRPGPRRHGPRADENVDRRGTAAGFPEAPPPRRRISAASDEPAAANTGRLVEFHHRHGPRRTRHFRLFQSRPEDLLSRILRDRDVGRTQDHPHRQDGHPPLGRADPQPA